MLREASFETVSETGMPHIFSHFHISPPIPRFHRRQASSHPRPAHHTLHTTSHNATHPKMDFPTPLPFLPNLQETSNFPHSLMPLKLPIQSSPSPHPSKIIQFHIPTTRNTPRNQHNTRPRPTRPFLKLEKGNENSLEIHRILS